VSLEVEGGEFVALLGPSGCGKTTLLNTIAGFVEADSGSVEINGQVVSRSTPPYLRNLGVVFQNYALFPNMTVGRNIAFPLEVRRLPPTQLDGLVERALAMVDLSHLRGRFPHELSGGQQQRVALARALVYSPPVLLLDEPLGALDRRLRDAMQAELKDLHRRVGTTFVYVTHDQDEALAMADRVVVMRNGAVEQHGTPLELYEKPVNRFVAKFVGECNVLSGTWITNGGTRILMNYASSAVLHQRSADSSVASSSVAIRPEWLHVAGLDEPSVNGRQHLTCHVLQTRFHGSETLLTLASPAGDLLARVPHRRRSELDLSAHLVNVWWDPGETVLLSDEPAPEAAS